MLRELFFIRIHLTYSNLQPDQERNKQLYQSPLPNFIPRAIEKSAILLIFRPQCMYSGVSGNRSARIAAELKARSMTHSNDQGSMTKVRGRVQGDCGWKGRASRRIESGEVRLQGNSATCNHDRGTHVGDRHRATQPVLLHSARPFPDNN